MNWYYKFLVRKPFLVILSIGVLCLACIIVSLTTKQLPDFRDPTLGFEARGTQISQRLTAWENLFKETETFGSLVANPNEILNVKKKYRHKTRKKKNKNLKTKLKMKMNDTDLYESVLYRNYEINGTLITRDPWEYGLNTSYIDYEDAKEIIQSQKDKLMSLRNFYSAQKIDVYVVADGFFCESPNKDYSHFVIRRHGLNFTESLFEMNSFQAMCQLEQQIVKVEGYVDFCQKELLSDNCCRPWSLPNYVALLSNKTTCFEIDQDDVLAVHNLLLNCFEYFHNLELSNDCMQYKCRVPNECTQFNAVFNIFHYLTDINFIKDSHVFLKSAMIFIPIAKSMKTLTFFHNVEKSNLENDLVKVIAMDMGLKNALFNECLLSDGWLVGLSLIFVMTSMWLYTSSLFVTIMTMIATVFSLGIAYFVYTLVFEMSFFPFMNLLAVVVVIGIGADDAFIFVKIWQYTITERIRSSGVNFLEKHSPICSVSTYTETVTSLMASTFKQAALSMFVTSLTTAAAFYASYISSITSVKCFGIFAGTAIISNYLLMITWLPASVSIVERIPCQFGKYFSTSLSQKINKSISEIGSCIRTYIMNLIINKPVLWVTFLGVIGISSGVVVLYWPRLQLPESPDFQLFVKDHPFELYESEYRDEFWFEKSVASNNNFKLPLRFVWGILPLDKGDFSNPFSRGELYFDNNFNLSSLESQRWLLNFCKKLKKKSFYQTSFGMLLPNCFIENFVTWMSRKCIDNMDEVDRTPCCEISRFPYTPHVFEYCLPHSISALYATPREFFAPGVAGPKFARPTKKQSSVSPPIVKVLVVEYESNISYSMSYSKVKDFVSIVQKWFDDELLSAPLEMQGGWFISDLIFFDLQDTLSKGTVISIGISMCASFFVLLFVTLNVLISVYAVLTVSFTIFTTVAILILFGWKLNILESVSVSTAIGLAVDFSLHYGIHYRLSGNSDRQSATNFALVRMIGPTAMAALTTSIAGALMLASDVLPYIQIGLLLVIVMTVSWIYSTFFLMSLLRLIGPQYGFMQLSYPSLSKIQKKTTNREGFVDRMQNQVIISELLLTPTSSAAGDIIDTESHELDSLNSNSIIKAISVSESSRNVDFYRMLSRK